MAPLSPWALTAICASFICITHAADQCSNLYAPEVTIPNGDFESGHLAPWDQYPAIDDTERASIISPGYRSRYAVKIPLPSINYNKHPNEYNYTGNFIIQQIYNPQVVGACYKITFAWNWLYYHGPENSSLCNVQFDASGLGYLYEEASRRPGWHEKTFYATPSLNDTNFDIQANLVCLPDETTNTTPRVVLLLDHMTVKTLHHPLPPGTPIQSE